METNLLDKMLGAYRSQKTPVTIVLQNNARITGTIGTFDSYVIVMESQRNEIVYRHAISAVLPYIAAEQLQPREHKAASAPARPAPRPAPKAPRPAPPAAAKSRPARPEHTTAAAPSESGLNTGMKEGLLRWMQEQKAGK
jgi:host factor-I protein